MTNYQLPTTEPLIELKGISKTFGNNKVLDNVDLTIYRGQALGIIGPSGTGKSTVLRIIAGLLKPDEGEIYVQGVRRSGLIEDAADPVGIGMVFQQAALFDSLTVEENIGFLLYQNSRLKRSRIRELVNEKLDMVGLSSINHLYPSELSGGMRKRVSFARAIMSNPDHPTDSPEVLLYDEPTAGLDPIASTVIEDLIRNLQHTHGVCSTYSIVTHQDSTIRRTSDQIVFLYQGKVQWQGTVSEIDNTENPLIRQFMSGKVQGPIQVAG
ncbi:MULTISPECIES: ABC transporter ATP-binding protein [unclassified Anabaena]|uniref:ABC transporter ATP-binding protein n=1 Tax=unclassified Anabaena TaxID=2619674 RepID=UPI001445F074|nr:MULTISPECIES: ABC transporter ATP-binding protein [unclassified Anabaena]MTJ06254.1 ABC transporter ATP-binding protein [Anabaena sp. UHCC 0204]MTJ54654.1 ABC transporter ATP-binding protein [Anabaena sp. UHCC 0253]